MYIVSSINFLFFYFFRMMKTFYIDKTFVYPKIKKSGKIIATSLYGSQSNYCHNALRYSLFTKVYFPDWGFRVYVELPDVHGETRFPSVPETILKKLEYFGSNIIYVNSSMVPSMPQLWRFLVADDPLVDTFMIRDADARPTEREATIIREWLDSGKAFHCIRDHPHHQLISQPIFGGMWGGRSAELHRILGNMTMIEIMMKLNTSSSTNDQAFLARALWQPVLRAKAGMCHDSHHCHKMHPQNSRPMPPLTDGEFVGRQYKAYGTDRNQHVNICRKSFEQRCENN